MSLLDQITERVKALEEEWEGLGNDREISFVARFCAKEHQRPERPDPKDAVRGFSEIALRFDCESGSWVDQYGDYTARAWKSMKPIPGDIAKIVEKIEEYVIANDGYFDGWFYPSRINVEFLPGRKHDERAVKSRADVLFGVAPPIDRHSPADSAFLRAPIPTSSDKFNISPTAFVRAAEKRAPSRREPTASAFSQWIYSIYADAYGSDFDRERGADAESEIRSAKFRKLKMESEASVDNNRLRQMGSSWRLIHCGLNYDDRVINYYNIDKLKIDGVPLRASPDLMYKNSSTSSVIIVEIKHSKLDIPRNLWPNIWGQLWCYSHIEIADRASEITVVGEVWGDDWKRYSGERYVYLRSSVRRDPRKPAFDRFFRRLFDIYSGGAS